MNACNLLVYGAGQVIPSFFRIMILLQSSLEFFEQWDPGGHLDVLARDKSSHFSQWDHRGWSLVHRMSKHAMKALYQNENSGSSSSEVEETDVGVSIVFH